MKQSVIAQIAIQQKVEISSYSTGLTRIALAELPDVQSHALIVWAYADVGKAHYCTSL